MSDDPLLTQLNDGALTLTLNRPEKRNALDTGIVNSLLRELDGAELDREVRVVLVRGAGKDFCAGAADLAELLATVEHPADQNAADTRRLGGVFLKMRQLPKVVVAAVHGRALGDGCGLASACDLVLARDDATFGCPEVKRGFVPAMVMALLRRSVGEKVAFDLVSTGRMLSAAEALGVGLVSRVLPTEGFEERLNEIVWALAEGSGTAMALTKRHLYEIEGRDFRDAIELGARVNALSRATSSFSGTVEQLLKQ
jgi:methylglutaconyl-CoA hydratase